MTKRQANLISEMCENAFDIKRFDKAHAELLQSCSDTEPCPVATPQPTVTVSTNSTAPIPPSTPKPLGPEWWKERQAEAAQEQMEIIKAQAQKIQSLQKQISEDREHWDKQALINKEIGEHNEELEAAYTAIYEALKHWGLKQSEPCSLVDNVKQVIQLCAERGKAHFEQKDKIERLNDQIDSQSKVIAELTEQRDQWEELAAKRAGEMNRRSDMIDMMEKQGDRKDKEIKALKATCDIRQGFIDKGREVSDELRKQLMEKSAEIESKTKVIESLKKSIEVLDRVCQTRQQFNETEREINHKKTVEVEAIKKQLDVSWKKRQAIVEAGNKLRDRLRIMGNQYFMPQQQHVENSNAIALWEDNTTP